MFIRKICQALNQAKVPYAIVGGYAVAFHGAVRGTFDVDIAIIWNLDNLQNIEKIFNQLGLVSRIPIDADTLYHFRDEYIQNKNMLAWNFYDPTNPINQVDVIINYDLKGSRTQSMQTIAGPVKVIARKDLIDMKRKAGRPQDLEDIRALEAL